MDDELVAPVYVPCSSAVWLPAWTLRDGSSDDGNKLEKGNTASRLIRIRIDLPRGSRREVQWLDLSQLTNLNDFNGKLPIREPNHGNKKLGVRIHDLGQLSIAHEAAVLDVLRNRWNARQYCVMAGPALLFMRPPCTSYVNLPPHICDAYLRHKEEGSGPVDMFPHLHTVALMAHRDLWLFAQDQYIFLAGEEGTGKRWCSEQLLSFLCEGTRPADQRYAHSVTTLLSLMTTPAEKGADSRAGVCFELDYERTRQLGHAGLNGAKLRNLRVEAFLLDHKYVVTRPREAAPYAVLQHLWSTNPAILEYLMIDRPASNFRYLRQSNNTVVMPSAQGGEQTGDSRMNFQCLVEAIRGIGVSEDDAWIVIKGLVAVLHIGQIPLWNGTQPSSYLNDRAVGKVAALLGLSPYDLRQAVEQEARIQEEGLSPSLGFMFSCQLPPKTSYRYRGQPGVDACDSLASAVYALLFNVLVRRMAVWGKPALEDRCVLGVVDMFSLDSQIRGKTLHRLLSNYAEELMRHAGVLSLPRLYEDELLNTHGKMGCLQGTGLNNLLQVNLTSHLADFSTTHTLSNGGLGRYLITKRRYGVFTIPQTACTFTIQHYVGEITYEPHDFKEHNLGIDGGLLRLLTTSTIPLIADAATQMLDNQTRRWVYSTTDDGMVTGRNTVGEKLQVQLNNLVERSQGAKHHLVLCIKPNDEDMDHQASTGYITQTVARQLRALWMSNFVEMGRLFSGAWSIRLVLDRYRSLTKVLACNARNRPQDSFRAPSECNAPACEALPGRLKTMGGGESGADGGGDCEQNHAPNDELGGEREEDDNDTEACDLMDQGNNEDMSATSLLRRLCARTLPAGSYEVTDTQLFLKGPDGLGRLEGILRLVHHVRAKMIQARWRRSRSIKSGI